MMTDRLADLFETAVGTLPMSEARALDIFTEITDYDESACDAWIGRIRCGDTDRATLFRAWYSRRNFGQLAASARISMGALAARVPIGGLYGDITYPVTSPLAIAMGFAASEAAQGNFERFVFLDSYCRHQRLSAITMTLHCASIFTITSQLLATVATPGKSDARKL